jgi:CTP synthase
MDASALSADPVRYVFVTGGVVSSLGKGIAAASIAALLQAHGHSVRLRKLDPYLNVDPGTMSPFQHGECFVTEDGAEVDLDFGHYERFTGVRATRADTWTTGRIYSEVIARERRGDYLGATVQVVPHVTDAVKAAISSDVGGAAFVVVELGGTVGDIEGLPFIEAIRQFSNERPPGACMFVHLTLVPWVAAAGELKTKPTQRSVKDLLGLGIQPDLLLCRCDRPIPAADLRKVAAFCNLRPDAVLAALDVPSILAVPLAFREAGVDRVVLSHFSLCADREPHLGRWRAVVASLASPEGAVRVAVVGKYASYPDAYKSLAEALTHAGIAVRVGVDIDWVDSATLATGAVDDRLLSAHALIVPGGFGERGTDGMIDAIRHARERRVPFLGICFGMQLAVVETARNVAGLVGASSAEFGPSDDEVVGLMSSWDRDGAEQRREAGMDMGGTMRLGAYSCDLADGSLVRRCYGRPVAVERHRHRYEVNARYRGQLARAGMLFSAMSPDGRLPEAVERPEHPWFLGVQFHPELSSTPFGAHPLFRGLVGAALARSRLI